MGIRLRIDPHTLLRAEERGATETEIRDVLETGDPIPAKTMRLAKAKVYPFDRERNGKYYAHKRVEVIYVEEDGLTVTVTVYVFFGQWTI